MKSDCYWQDAYAEEYTIQLSDDGETFTDVKAITGSDGGEDIITLNGEQGRYLRILCTKAVPSDDGWQWNYGYSLFEVEAYEAKSADVDKTALNEAIAAAQALNEEDYTANSWNAVSTALDNAMNVAADDTADQNAVDNCDHDALNNAVAALQNRASQGDDGCPADSSGPNVALRMITARKLLRMCKEIAITARTGTAG